MQLIGQVLYFGVLVFIVMLWVRFVVDWVQVFDREWTPRGPLLVALEVVYSVTDPPVLALRRVIPPLKLGAVALDLSFLIVLLGAYFLLNMIAGTMLR